MTTNLRFENLIDNIGCNILAIHSFFDRVLIKDNVKKVTHKEYAEALKKDIWEEIKNDDDYAQVGFIQLGHNQRVNFQQVFLDHFTVLSAMELPGGHGNQPCLFIIIDLRPIRKEYGSNDSNDVE